MKGLCRYCRIERRCPKFKKHDFVSSGCDEENIRMEILELDDHPYFVATQYHPEYLSRPLKPSPPFFGLILASVGKLHSYLARGCRLTPRQLSDVESGNQLNVNS
jgi:CTP synthase